MFIEFSLRAVVGRPSLSARLPRGLVRAAVVGTLTCLFLCRPGAVAGQTPAAPRILLPAVALTASDLGIVVNDADPDSIEVGAYYAQARKIPPERVVHVRFPAAASSLGEADFRRIKEEVDARMPAQVQALALAWTKPYRVDCMSMTSAFAFGFDPRHCADGCQPTRLSPYFNSDSTAPQRELGMRPAMMLAAPTVATAKLLIDRGVRSDDTWPAGKAYLVSTSDSLRNIRASTYGQARSLVGTAYPVEPVTTDVLRDRSDVMFYFTGLVQVSALGSNRFLDGAIADHLTSNGGMLTDSPQMSVLEWIEAGATGSYGTASEPCNFRQKFPNVPVVLGRYLSGETLIEAYWKAVEMPGQGVFVGEPLARPFGGIRGRISSAGFDVQTRSLRRGRYVLQGANSAVGPYRDLAWIEVRSPGVQRLRFSAPAAQVYRLLRAARNP
jgi:uncharacterized protein (TIGR03790 family)